MVGDERQSRVKTADLHHSVLLEPVAQPKQPAGGNALIEGELSERPVSGQQLPAAALGDGIGEGVRRRESRALAPNDNSPRQLDGIKFLDAQTETDEMVAKIAFEFAFKEQVRDRKLIRKPKQALK